MNLKRTIWRSSHVEEILGIGWTILAILTYGNEKIRFVTLVFAVLAISSFVAAIMRGIDESKQEKQKKKYQIIKEDDDHVMMRIIENNEDHPEHIEHNGCIYTLQSCDGKSAIFKRERKE